MYFFTIDISSFDDASKTLFVIPEQNADEQGVPFEDKIVTQTADFKQFVKETATSMVDGVYTQFRCEDALENVTEKIFAQLQAEGKLTQIDSNSFSISTGFKPKKSGGKKDMKMYLGYNGSSDWNDDNLPGTPRPFLRLSSMLSLQRSILQLEAPKIRVAMSRVLCRIPPYRQSFRFRIPQRTSQWSLCPRVHAAYFHTAASGL